jgi:hypothetical protein
MKTKSIVLAVALSAALFSGCSTPHVARPDLQESKFSSRLEYLRFCQTNELMTGRCQ